MRRTSVTLFSALGLAAFAAPLILFSDSAFAPDVPFCKRCSFTPYGQIVELQRNPENWHTNVVTDGILLKDVYNNTHWIDATLNPDLQFQGSNSVFSSLNLPNLPPLQSASVVFSYWVPDPLFFGSVLMVEAEPLTLSHE